MGWWVLGRRRCLGFVRLEWLVIEMVAQTWYHGIYSPSIECIASYLLLLDLIVNIFLRAIEVDGFHWSAEPRYWHGSTGHQPSQVS